MLETYLNFTELFGVLTAFIYLYFSVKQKIWLWPFGILTSLSYMVIFFSSRLYADMGLQVYYFFVSIYGWYFWTFSKRRGNKDKLPVVTTSGKEYSILILVSLVLYVLIVVALKNIPPMLGIPASDLLWWDAFTTALSITATWMLARKMIEQWIIWVLVDTVSMILYIYKGLYPTAVLFFIYSFIAVYGYTQWRKDLIPGR